MDIVVEQPITYEVHPTLTGICITCTFLDSSTTDCVAVVHQRISQLSSSGLMNIKSRRKFNRSGDTAYGCIEGFNIEEHQVGVVGGRRIPQSKGNKTSYSICIYSLRTDYNYYQHFYLL